VNFPNLSARYARELRPFLPDCFETSVVTPERPELAAWQSMYEYVTDQMACQQLEGATISKQQYEEWGHERVNRFFESNC
jgi:actin-related protein